MSGVVHVLHPVPVRHVPRGGRKERVSHRRHVTPVRLVEAAPAAFEPLARLSGVDVSVPRMVHAHEGGLWMPLLGHAGKAGASVPAEVLRSWLADQYKGDIFAVPELYDFFNRTPVLGRKVQPEGANRAGTVLTRGEDFAPGQVAEDGTDRAERDLRDFLDGNVRICGQEVMVRCPGLVAGMDPNWLMDRPLIVLHPRSNQGRMLCRVDRVAELRGFLARLAGSPEDRRFGHWQMPPGIDADLLRDDDLLVYANELPRRTLYHLDVVARRGGLPEAVADRYGRLNPWLALGEVGAIRPEECEAVLGVVQEVLDGLDEEILSAPLNRALRRDARYIAEIALPRARETGPDDEADLAALAGPGRM